MGYIEFVGLPGSGKSSVVDGIRAQLPARDFAFPIQGVQERERFQRSVLRAFGAMAGIFDDSVRHLCNSLLQGRLPRNLSELKGCLNFLWLARAVSQTKGSTKKVILTEGLLQAWWGLRVRQLLNDSTIDTVLHFMEQHSCRVIYLDCDVSVLRHRLDARSQNSYLDKVASSDGAVTEAATVCGYITTRLQESNMPVYVVDSGGSSLSVTVDQCLQIVRNGR